jgi:DNA-3-methyladenine glycosylase
MLTQSFFEGKTVEELANALLGCELVHESPEGPTAGIIVETESYHETDEASHTFRGKTKRNEVMFGPSGYAYIYFTYGMHYCFNITAEEEGVGAAVLLRALEPTQGIDLMKQRRDKERVHDLCSGPAKLVQAMGITKADYGKPVFAGELRLNPREEAPSLLIRSGPRVGISKAKDKPWRFWLEDNPFVSGQPKP